MELPDLQLPADVELPEQMPELPASLFTLDADGDSDALSSSLDNVSSDPLSPDLLNVTGGSHSTLQTPDAEMYWPDREIESGEPPVTLSGQRVDDLPTLSDSPLMDSPALPEITLPSVLSTDLPESENYDLSRYEPPAEGDSLSLPLEPAEDSHDPHLDLLREIAEGVKGLKPQSGQPDSHGPSQPTQFSTFASNPFNW